jgi:CDP-diacylglycerol pyrophosphatase
LRGLQRLLGRAATEGEDFRMSQAVNRFRRRAPGLIKASRFFAAGVLGFFLWLHGSTASSAADPNALWTIVHGLCAVDQQAFGRPAPCAEVDLKAGYAVLKDLSGASQYLLIPTARVSGVESPKLLAPDSPNYFEDAWKARRFVAVSLGRSLPREDIGLSINSMYGRSQNQLHIHVDCVRPEVRAALNRLRGRIGPRWMLLKTALAGHRYRAMRIDGNDLPIDPFKLLARTDRQARANMGRETLVAIGAAFPGGRPGFYLLSDRATAAPLDRGSGEDLLDHSCRPAR